MKKILFLLGTGVGWYSHQLVSDKSASMPNWGVYLAGVGTMFLFVLIWSAMAKTRQEKLYGVPMERHSPRVQKRGNHTPYPPILVVGGGGQYPVQMQGNHQEPIVFNALPEEQYQIYDE